LAGHLVKELWCGDRLQGLGGAQRLVTNQHPDHPIHSLAYDKTALKTFGDAFWNAFGMHVIIDGWSSVQLRLSRDKLQGDFIATTEDGLPVRDVVERLEKLPLIDTQSDG
jgi:hypothetical protein